MLSLINLSVNDRRKTVVSQLNIVFAEGHIHGLFAPDASLLRPLLECFSGLRPRYTGKILLYDRPLSSREVSYTDCLSVALPGETLHPEPVFQSPSLSAVRSAGVSRLTSGAPRFPAPASPAASLRQPPDAGPDLSGKLVILHDLRRSLLSATGAMLTEQLRREAAKGKPVLISGHDYPALRETCDYIYLFDKNRFPIVVGKADFEQFDDYFKNVFGPGRP